MSRHQTSGSNGGQPLALVSGIAGMLFGVIVGYLLGAPAAPGAAAIAGPVGVAQPIAAPQPAAPVVNEAELQAYRDILKADPKNVRAATELGNRLYDAGRYSEAIIYYEQAFALDQKNVSVSTDLATAIWYVGRADEALAQFQKSLDIAPTHPQTLFNIGIVRSEGKRDYAGAVQAWQTLLSANPSYPDAERVRRLIEDAKRQAGSAAATAGAPVR
jgi:tetratricopeptide (TPR) repeat protein